MSLIMDLIGTELSELSALELENLPFFTFFFYTLAPANIDRSVPNLATTNIPIRSRMSSIMEQIESEYKISDEFDYGTNPSRTVRLVCQ